MVLFQIFLFTFLSCIQDLSFKYTEVERYVFNYTVHPYSYFSAALAWSSSFYFVFPLSFHSSLKGITQWLFILLFHKYGIHVYTLFKFKVFYKYQRSCFISDSDISYAFVNPWHRFSNQLTFPAGSHLLLVPVPVHL